jgi:KDO2-lipid IV(A) lauroyltransferase
MTATSSISTAIMTKRIRYRLEYLAVVTLIFILNLIPYRIALLFGDTVGILAFSVFRIRRKVTMDNLEKSLGDSYTRVEYKRIAARAYRYIGRGMIEYGLFPSLKKKNLERFLTIAGEDNLSEIESGDRGAVLVTGHFGSWELMGAFLASRGWPIDYLVGEQHNLLVNRLMNDHRRLFGIGLIEMGVAARGVIKAIRNGRMVCMLSDQDAGSDGAIVSFLGRPASTPKGPAAFALKTGAPLACGFIIREGWRQKVIIEPPIDFRPSGDKDNDVRELTQKYTNLLEGYIRKHPDHWFWPHRRWKSTT